MKNKMVQLLDTSTKKIIASLIVLVIIIASGLGVYALTKEKVITLSLMKDKESIIIEYGETLELEVKDYLDLTKVDKKDQENVLKEVKIESTLKNEDTKEYPGIGKYEITITYKKQKLVSKVEVKDTTAPVFNEISEISFEEGTEYDYSVNITASDLQELTLEFDTANVNKDVPGEYTVKAVTKDKSNNETTKDIKVIVTAKPVVETPSNNGSSNAGGTTSSGSTGSANTGSTNKPSSGGVSNSGSSNTGGSNSSENTIPPPPPEPEKPHVHTFTPYAGKWFNNGTELMNYAEDYIISQNFKYSTYGTNQCTCGKWGITIFE